VFKTSAEAANDKAGSIARKSNTRIGKIKTFRFKVNELANIEV
jgi:hypothetical protein